MKHEEKDVKSINELITMLRAHSEGEPLWFRGQADLSWELTPSIYRAYPSNPVETEWALLKRFRQNAPQLLSNTISTEWDWLFLMQHYGVETRLMDWTEGPLSALYFSVENSAYDRTDGSLYVLDPSYMNRMLGNASAIQNDFPLCGLDTNLDGFLTSKALASIDAGQYPVAAMAPRNSARIAAQLGVFVVYHADFKPLEQLGDTQHIWRYRIPAASKCYIREELDLLEVNKFSLFPELSNAGQLAKERLNG